MPGMMKRRSFLGLAASVVGALGLGVKLPAKTAPKPVPTPLPTTSTNPFDSLGKNLYVSLHTADPYDGTQSTHEVSYGSYARVRVPRSSDGWHVFNQKVNQHASRVVVKPTEPIVFPMCTSVGGVTATHFSVGTHAKGAGTIYYSGQLLNNWRSGHGLTIGNGVIVSINPTITED